MKTRSDSLRQLPDFDPPADGWSRLDRSLDRRPDRRPDRSEDRGPTMAQARPGSRRPLHASGWGLALAASLTLAIGVKLTALGPDPGWVDARSSGGDRADPALALAGQAGQTAQLNELMRRSRNLEEALGQARSQVGVWDARSAAEVAALQRGLQLVDLQLDYTSSNTDSDQAQRLWTNRVDLMSRLLLTLEQSAPARAQAAALQETSL